MYDTELAFAVDVVAEACAIARLVQDRIAATKAAVTKADRSPVTVADLAIQAVVTRRLEERFPDDALLAEEEAAALDADLGVADEVLDLVRHHVPAIDPADLRRTLDRGDYEEGRGRYWVLDPIDGTKGFLRGDQYAVALALVAGGRAVVGALGCPNLGDGGSRGPGLLLSAVHGKGASERRLDGSPPRAIAVDDVDDPADATVCESVEAAHAAHSEQARIAERLGIRRAPVRIDSQCKYGVLARGDASIYLRLPRRADYREKVWDHAAGAVVITEAGGRVTDLEGRPLELAGGRYLGRSRGIVATNGRIHEQVLRACREVLDVAS